MWASYDPAAEAAAEEKRATESMRSVTIKERKTDYKPVIVTEVSDDVTFWYQSTDTGKKDHDSWFGKGRLRSSQTQTRSLSLLYAAALRELMTKLNEALKTSPPTRHQSRKNEMVAAQFSFDRAWYRARVLSVTGDDVEVRPDLD